ncbi:hypothetical protein ACTXJX_13285 [Glutamicibacter ardleyensis]
MATNKYPALCSETWCDKMLEVGMGVLHNNSGKWQVFCPEHVARQSRSMRDEQGELVSKDPLVIFLYEQFEAEEVGTSGFGGRWFHQPARSGIVVNELREVECRGLRTTADHLVTWQPLNALKNIESRSLILTLYVDTPKESEQRSGLRYALCALAMNYMDDPRYLSSPGFCRGSFSCFSYAASAAMPGRPIHC